MTVKIIDASPNIWNSFEMYCICRDFKYQDYIDLHVNSGQRHSEISEYFYDCIRRGFNSQMQQDFEELV